MRLDVGLGLGLGSWFYNDFCVQSVIKATMFLSLSLCLFFVRLFENLNVIKYESGRLVKLLNASSKTSVCIKINLE